MLEFRVLVLVAIVIAAVAAIYAGVQTEALSAEAPPSPVAAPPAPTGGECLADTDCATGGCSGQICTTAAAAPGIVTTCEWREEYDCLRLTSCGCVDGTCAWRNNSAYAACLLNLSG